MTDRLSYQKKPLHWKQIGVYDYYGPTGVGGLVELPHLQGYTACIFAIILSKLFFKKVIWKKTFQNCQIPPRGVSKIWPLAPLCVLIRTCGNLSHFNCWSVFLIQQCLIFIFLAPFPLGALVAFVIFYYIHFCTFHKTNSDWIPHLLTNRYCSK